MRTIRVTFTPQADLINVVWALRINNSTCGPEYHVGLKDGVHAARAGVFQCLIPNLTKTVAALRECATNVQVHGDPSIDVNSLVFDGNDAYNVAMDKATNAIDAMLFNGDPNGQICQTLRNYLSRWERRLNEIDASRDWSEAG